MSLPPTNPSKTNHKQAIGRWGEDTAAAFLESNGVKIIARNYRTEYGELDIIGKQGDHLIMFEVRTRTSTKFGHPEESINFRKRNHLISAAEAYVMQESAESEWRIDVIAIRRIAGQPPEITWFQNAVVE